MSLKTNTDNLERIDLCFVKTLFQWVVLDRRCHCNVLVRSQNATDSFITL